VLSERDTVGHIDSRKLANTVMVCSFRMADEPVLCSPIHFIAEKEPVTPESAELVPVKAP